MTDSEKNLIIDFKVKVKQIIAKHEVIKQENHQLLGKIEDLEKLINQLHQENRVLEQKYENLKIAKILTVSNNENKDAKGKIQSIVREIDKCIALLNR